MEFELGTAIGAGLVATAVMTAAMYMGYLMNMRMDIPMILGTMFMPKGQAAWLLGLMLHLMMGAVFYSVYAALFDLLALDSGIVGWSALFGLIHGVVAGMAMGMVPAMHPRMVTAAGSLEDTGVISPGLFASALGSLGPLAILALHVLYGAVGGLVYA